MLAVLTHLLSAPGNVGTVQYRYRNKDGSYTWMEAVAGNQAANPLVHAIVAVSRDITERRVAEERLRDSEGRYRPSAAWRWTLSPAPPRRRSAGGCWSWTTRR